MLGAMIDNLPDLDRNSLKDLLRGLVKRNTLDPKNVSLLYSLKNQAKFGGIGGVPKGIRPNLLYIKTQIVPPSAPSTMCDDPVMLTFLAVTLSSAWRSS